MNSKNVSSQAKVTSGFDFVSKMERGVRIGNIVLTPAQSERLVAKAKEQLSFLQKAELHGWMTGVEGYEKLYQRTSNAFAKAVSVVILDKIAMNNILAK